MIAEKIPNIPSGGHTPKRNPCHHNTFAVFPAKISHVLRVYGQTQIPIIPKKQRQVTAIATPPTDKVAKPNHFRIVRGNLIIFFSFQNLYPTNIPCMKILLSIFSKGNVLPNIPTDQLSILIPTSRFSRGSCIVYDRPFEL